MKQVEIVQLLEEILTDVPTEPQIHVALRYAGTGEVIRRISVARGKLEALKAKLTDRSAA